MKLKQVAYSLFHGRQNRAVAPAKPRAARQSQDTCVPRPALRRDVGVASRAQPPPTLRLAAPQASVLSLAPAQAPALCLAPPQAPALYLDTLRGAGAAPLLPTAVDVFSFDSMHDAAADHLRTGWPYVMAVSQEDLHHPYFPLAALHAYSTGRQDLVAPLDQRALGQLDIYLAHPGSAGHFTYVGTLQERGVLARRNAVGDLVAEPLLAKTLHRMNAAAAGSLEAFLYIAGCYAVGAGGLPCDLAYSKTMLAAACARPEFSKSYQAGTDALILAFDDGHPAVAEYLLPHLQLNLSARVSDQPTALMLAAVSCPELVQLLLKHGANINAELSCEPGVTALAGAARAGMLSTAELLAQASPAALMQLEVWTCALEGPLETLSEALSALHRHLPPGSFDAELQAHLRACAGPTQRAAVERLIANSAARLPPFI